MVERAQRLSVPDLVERSRSLARGRGRVIIGIAGAPGAGKSTLAQALVSSLGAETVWVPMDGFHLADHVLTALGRRDRKGAPDTFDAAGYVALLGRLRDRGLHVVYAPAFHRDREEPIAGSIPVPPETQIVVTDGNYLLLTDPPWSQIAGLLDEAWFLRPAEEVRQTRLIARHIAYGKSPVAARDWALGTDQRNAELVTASADRADLVLAFD